jgi:hypothetical protein
MITENFNKKVWLLIMVSSLIRLFFSFNVELGNDEVYYWTFSHHLAWNYFDHPPLIAFLIRFFTANLTLESMEGFVRLGSLVCCGLSTYFIYKTTQYIHSSRAGFYAGLIYTGSVYASVISGIMVMPDSPQMVFWTSSLWVLSKIFSGKDSYKNWLLFGLLTGLCIMSKAHGIFLWFGLGIYIILKKREILVSGKLYLAIAFSFILASPILFWNIQNQFITYRYHSQRVIIQGSSINFLTFFRELLGQFLYNNPILVIFTLVALFNFKKIQIKSLSKIPLVLFNFIGIPMAVLILGISLFRETLPHWTGPAYVSLIPLTAIYFTQIPISSSNFSKKYNFGIPVGILASLISLFLFLLLAYSIINFYPGTLNSGPEFSQLGFLKPTVIHSSKKNAKSKETSNLGEDDISLDLFGWRKAGLDFGNVISPITHKPLINRNFPLVIQKWFPGGHLDYYFCRPIGMSILGLGELNNLHQYYWYNFDWLNRNLNKTPDTAYTVIPSNLPLNIREEYKFYYTNFTHIMTISSSRGSIISENKIARNFEVYKMSGWKGRVPFIEAKNN